MDEARPKGGKMAQEPALNPLASERARAARILCAITFHFVGARIGFLAEVLRSLSEFPVAAMDVAIVTNTFRDEDLAPLRRLCAEIFSGKNATVRSYGDLAHPFNLAWCHKDIIASEFASGNNGRYTHFIYLEDDIRLSFANFCYFTEFREALRGFGLLPSFVRVEWSATLGGFVASDAFWPVYVPVQASVLLGDTVMVNMPNPYNPCFILDVELAEEYVRSRSFDREASTEVCSWGVRERAAMGLCLENVPPPFQSRYAVPVSTQTDMVPSVARISHLPNNYADDPRMPLGKIRIDSLFKGARALVTGNWWPSRERGGDGGSRGKAPCEIGHGSPDEVVSNASGTASPRPQSAQTISSDRYHLISHHGTIVYADEAARRLRHGPFGIAPLNLVLELAGPRAHLILLENDPPGNRKLSFTPSTGEICWLSDSADPDFQVEYFPDGSIGLRTRELYVAADLDGMVRNDRSWCRAFEQFRLTISPDRYYLISHFDTILYVDEAAQRLRHAPFGIAPLNLALELAGPQGRLIFLENNPTGYRKLSFALSTGEIRLLSDSADPDIQIESFADGSIGLRTCELYVAADLDGMVRSDRPWCRAFEQFRLARADTIDGLAILQRHSWISHRDRQIVTLASQPIDFGPQIRSEASALAATLAAGAVERRRDIAFGPARIRLVGRAAQIAFDRTVDADPNGPLDVFITDATGTRYGFSRLRP